MVKEGSEMLNHIQMLLISGTLMALSIALIIEHLMKMDSLSRFKAWRIRTLKGRIEGLTSYKEYRARWHETLKDNSDWLMRYGCKLRTFMNKYPLSLWNWVLKLRLKLV